MTKLPKIFWHVFGGLARGVLLRVETLETLEANLDPAKVNFLEVYCGGKGRLTVRDAAALTGWAASSGFRILCEARALRGPDGEPIGLNGIPNSKMQKQAEIRRVRPLVALLYGNGGTKRREVAVVVADLVGCSPVTVYRLI